MNNPLQKDFFSGQKWESFRQVESHLMTENTSCSRSSPIPFIDSFIHNLSEKIKILLFTFGHKVQINNTY
jgi:hypothetical protein